MTGSKENSKTAQGASEHILTGPNVVTLIRFLMIPLFLYLEFCVRQNLAAFFVFVFASCTDWIDGQLARRTNQVSKFGTAFDPFVDRLLLVCGVVTVCLLGRLPVWIVCVLVVRDLILVLQARYLLATKRHLPGVIYTGKFATAFLLFGYCFLLLGMPYVPGCGLFDISWLPGFGFDDTLLGTWLVYIGTILSLITFIRYQLAGIRMLHNEEV